MVKVKLSREKIERLLARKNLSQNWLAQKVQVSSGYMSQLMNGTRCASPKVRAKIQDTFIGSNFEELFKITNKVRKREVV